MKNFLLTHKKIFSLLVAVVFSLLISLFNSTFLSPIYIGFPYGSLNQDGQFFYYLGSLLLKGQTPYIDFFDHKGLYHIYIDSLGILLGGKIALFFIEFIFLAVSIYFIIESLRMIKEDNVTGLIFLGILSITLTVFRQSNGEGMWLLPFVSLIIYFYLLGKKKNNKYFLLSGLFIGIEMGLSLNSRPSDAIFGGVFALLFIVELIKEKKIKTLLLTAITAIISLGLIVLAFYLPAFKLGYAKEMFDATIIHNLLYISKTPLDVDIFVSKGIAILLLLVSILMTIYIYKKNKKDEYSFMFSFVSIGVSLLNIIIGHYLAYFLSISLFIALFITYYITKLIKEPNTEKIAKKVSPILGSCLVLVMLVIDLVLCYGPINNIFSYKEEERLAYNVNLVKEEYKNEHDGHFDDELKTIYAVDLTMSIYLEGDINTHTNVFGNQSWWSYADPSIKESVGELLHKGEYSYIFLGVGACYDYFLSKMDGIYTRYEPSGYQSSTQYTLYKII